MTERFETEPEGNHSTDYSDAMELLELADYALRFVRYGLLVARKPLREIRKKAEERRQENIKYAFEKHWHNI